MGQIHINRGSTLLSEIDDEIVHFLRNIRPHAENPDPDARQRIHTSPTHGTDPELDAEWGEYVTPGLDRLFASALDLIEQDLSNLDTDENGEFSQLIIPAQNYAAWINGLNQARLSLHARHGLDEAENFREAMKSATPERLNGLMTLSFYTTLQSWLVDAAQLEAEQHDE